MGLSRLNKLIAAAVITAAVVSHSSARAFEPASTWNQTVQRMAAPWPAIQRSDGTFPAYNYARASGELPYGESMLGYGLLQSGLAAGDRRQIETGLRAIGFASRALLRRGSPSVFENLALAASYNLAKDRLADDAAFVRVRPELERALRAITPVWNGTNKRYFNKYLVEAVAWLELTRTGLHSTTPGTVLANRTAARSAAARLVNRRIGSAALGFKPRGRGSLRTLILSDLPYNPAAYQGLSLGMMARAITLLGRDASPHARMVLREVANASWELTAPDGDLAYYGRSQEEAWALGLTAYGAEVAARGATAEQERRYRALAMRAMDHLATAYPVGPRGQWITPALAQDLEAAKHGLDRYADSVAYTGLSLVATSWAASVQDVSAAGSLASDRQSGYVVGQDISRIALVRTPSLWFAVKQARSDKIDLRYDFGLVALKAKATDGSWQNVVPSLPKVQGHPDSAGPTLASSHGPAYASGSHISVARDGTVRVIGSFTTAIGRRVRVRSAAFSYRPTGDCVTLSFAVHHGERMSYSAFVRPGAAASVNGVTANGERVSITPAAAAYQVEHGFSSGSDARLDRVRFALRGSGVIRIATCSA